ncbi:MAG: hypothetical protein OXL38_20970 [Gammaproteobacteria bacterium]|nr:hypothetical protein [Gammaproteobacteria bacterium]
MKSKQRQGNAKREAAAAENRGKQHHDAAPKKRCGKGVEAQEPHEGRYAESGALQTQRARQVGNYLVKRH